MHEQQIAALKACLERTPPTRERAKSDDELNWEAIREQQAEERAYDRRNRPLSRDEWARREEGAL